MITGELQSKVDKIWDTMWSGCKKASYIVVRGASTPKEV